MNLMKKTNGDKVVNQFSATSLFYMNELISIMEQENIILWIKRVAP